MDQTSTLFALAGQFPNIQNYFDMDLEDQLEMLEKDPCATNELVQFLALHQCDAPERPLAYAMAFVQARQEIPLENFGDMVIILN